MFGASLILARFLLPTDIGIFSIAVVFINIVAVFRDFGVSSYIVREEHLTASKIRSALGLVLTASWILALGLYIGADYISRYYKQPGVADVMHVLTFSFLLVPYASVLSALLMREMEAGKSAFVTTGSTLVFCATGITLAYLSYGYMAMAWANVANLVTNIACLLIVKPKGRILIPSFRGWVAPIRFGGGAIFSNLINVANSSLPDLLLGKVAGPREVGLYSRANGLVGIFQQIVGPAIKYNALPFIAKNHHAKAPFTPVFSTASSFVTCLAWPAFSFIGVFAKEVISTLYGNQWIDAAPLVMVLCTSAAVQAGYSLSQPALVAIGRPLLDAWANGINLLARLLCITFAFLWSPESPSMLLLATAVCIADVISLPIQPWLLSRYMGYPWKSSMIAHTISAKVATACLIATLLMKTVVPSDWPSLLQLLAAAMVEGGIWIVAIHFFSHPIAKELKRTSH